MALLIDKLLDNEDLADIPMEFIFRVAYEIMVLIASGDCFLKIE